jgi:hypothetical protein
MTRRLLAGSALALVVAFGLNIQAAPEEKKDEKKKDEKKPNFVATDPDKAGPDYAVQGEYVGTTADGAKLGAEVIARGDGNFQVNFLPGGLRGEGGDYAKHVDATGKTEGEKTTITGKDGKWTATVSGSAMTGKTAEGTAFTLKRVVRVSKTMGAKAPEGAKVLFDGKNADEWQNGKLVDGNLLGSDIDSKDSFKDFKMHVEFRLSFMPFAKDQGRSNSGVYLQHRYEVQVLDSFGLKGENNECGGIYTLAKPLVNMCYPPLTWQTYDVEFTAAKFEDGKKTAKARATVYHNGVLIHDNVELNGPTGGGRPEDEKPGPVFLQGHGGQVQYRNIWVAEKK